MYFDIAGTRAAAGRTTASSLFIDEAAPSPGTPSEQPGGGVDPRRRARHAAAAGSGHIAATPPLPNAHEHKHPRVSSAGAEGCTRGGMGSPTGLRLLRRGTFARASDSPDARVSPSSIFTAAKLSGGANANTNGNTNANGDANPTTPHARRDDPERARERLGAGSDAEAPLGPPPEREDEEEDVLLFDADAWLTGRGRFGAGLLVEEEVVGVGGMV